MSIKIGALNCRGLAERVKRIDFFEKCREKYDITILTDTHSKLDNENKWRQEWGYTCYFSSCSGNSRGVAVLFNKTFKHEVHKAVLDEDGNFIILDLTIQGRRISLVGIYGPNEDSPNFLKKISDVIDSLHISSIIMAGDWNVVQEYNLDTHNYRTKNNVKAHDKIHEMKESLDLVDIWRALNPEEKRYTWRGPDKKTKQT